VFVAAALLVCGCVFGAIKAFVFVRFLLYSRTAAAGEPAAAAAWRAEFGDPQALLASIPKQVNDDSTATTLIQRAKELGINLTRPAVRPDGSLDWPKADNAEVFGSVSEYVESELRKVDLPISPPPPSVSGFFEAHRSGVDRMIEFLVESEPPRWRMDETAGPESPLPNVSGLIRLQRVLAAEALMRAQRGDGSGADEVMRASWNLSASLRDRPELISQLIAISIARIQAGLARRIRLLPAEKWKARFQEHDYRASLLRALTVQASGRLAGLPYDRSTFSRATRADLMNMERRFLVACRDSPVTAQSVAVEQAASKEPNRFSIGEILGSIAIPNLADSWNRVNRLVVDLELTTRALEARAQRSYLGHWPKEIPGLEKSRFLGAQWVYSVSDAGRMSISFSVKPDWRHLQGLILPLEFSEE
jgi:hypothetical protein